MAQPLFDEHPLQEYFQETGEFDEVMPGSHPAFAAQTSTPALAPQQQTIVGKLVLRVLSRLQTFSNSLPSATFSHPPNAFAERFKYDVISSSLLSSSLAATPQPGRRTFVTELSGRSDTSSGDHSRTSSTSGDHTDELFGRKKAEHVFDPGDAKVVVGIMSAAVVAFAAGYELLTMLLLALALYASRATVPHREGSDATSLTLDAVDELISAGNVWDSAVNEAMSIIEKDERSPSAFYSSTSPQSPFLSLRVALQTSLNTTQSQCDNVRQLLAALTSPQQLAQLSEMYAPASPVKPSFASLDHPRPTSDPMASWRRRTTSSPSSSNKRATWSGTQASPLAHMKAGRRKDNRRSELNSLFLVPDGLPSSAPPTPLSQKILQNVKEEDGCSDSDSELPYARESDVFGVDALNLRRKRRSSGMESFGVPPPSYTSQPRGHSSHPSLSSFTSPSRFTHLQTNRHPFALSALQLALQGALAAKRYACAHLLALRFEEDADDDSYWEDVRSIMALLTSTFSDASTTLMAALDETEKKRIKDGRPSTESLAGTSRDGSVSPEMGRKPSGGLFSQPMRSMAEMTSFAPLPSHLTRFAAHVDAISSALNDAREHLEQCVANIRDEKLVLADTSMSPAASGTEQEPSSYACDEEAQDAALQAYDRLRKELGFAFRECERGRERLLDVIAASKPPSLAKYEDPAPPVPGLTHDASSEDSVGVETINFGLDKSEITVMGSDLAPPPIDDATEHLLSTATSQHLPLPGIEQVFEADTEGGFAFHRERSKLSREDRIKLAKARRESGLGLGISIPEESKPHGEKWGPGGEVVQELKDVIWKVGEKRRQLSERRSLETAPQPSQIESDPFAFENIATLEPTLLQVHEEVS